MNPPAPVTTASLSVMIETIPILALGSAGFAKPSNQDLAGDLEPLAKVTKWAGAFVPQPE